MDNQLSVYYHPTVTLLIDDSQSFLDSLAFQLNPRQVYKTFQDTGAAIEWLRREHRYFVSRQAEPVEVGYDELTNSFGRRNAQIDIERIYRKVMNRQRFNMAAVLVVDYAMPQMNGVEFCEAVKDLPCKKILLTGQADEKIATDAFNRKLIDCFIKKNDPDALARLDAEITNLQKDFFNRQTGTLKDLLSRHSYAFLADPALAVLVEQLCRRYRFVEYYLFPNPPGILFFDVQGKASLMVIETEASLISHFEIAQDQGAPPDLLAALREFRLVPFFSATGGVYLNAVGDDWLSYCLPPQICRGQEDYYWAVFDLPPHYLPGVVYPYAEFMRDQTGGLADAASR